jgi:hypothetical protein
MRMRTLRVRVCFATNGQLQVENILRDYVPGTQPQQIGLLTNDRFDRWFAYPSTSSDGTYVLLYQPLRGMGCRTMLVRVNRHPQELEIPPFIVELYDDWSWILRISATRLVMRVRKVLEEEHLVTV